MDTELKDEFKLSLEEWAALNSERYRKNELDHRVIGFEFQGFTITNPFLDVSGVETVDPKAVYGGLYAEWISRYQAAATAHAHAHAHTNKNVQWEVLVHAGMANENEVAIFNTYKEAEAYVDDEYSEEEKEELRVDITRNGSTEF